MTPEQGVFRALSDETRRGLLSLLARQEMNIAELSAQFDMTRAAVRKHLGVLEDGQLVSIHAAGRDRIVRFEPVALKPAHDWTGQFERFWDHRLSALKTAIDAEQKGSKP